MTEQLLANGKAADQKKDYSKCYLSLAVILFVCLLVLGGFSYYYIYHKKADPNCVSESCLKASLDIITSIDTSIEPCDNFPKFVCGKFSKTHKLYLTSQDIVREERINFLISEDPAEKDWLPLNLQKQFYQQCLNVEAIDGDFNSNILDLITKELGGWPILRGQWDHSKFNLTNFFIKCTELGLPFEWFFKISFGPSPDDPETSIVKIVKPDDLYHETDDVKHAAYIELILSTAAQLDAYKPTSTNEAKWIVNLEHGLEKIWSNYDESKEKSVTTDTLLAIFPIADLPYLIENLTGEFLVPGNASAVATDLDVLREINLLLAGFSEWTQVNFLIWKIIQSRGQFLSTPLRERFGNFENYYTESNADLSREGICLTEAKKRFPLVSKFAYMKNALNDTKNEKITEMIDNIRDHFVDHIENTDWIGNLTVPIVVNKIKNMKVIVKEYEDQQESLPGLLESMSAEVNFTTKNIYDMLSELTKHNFRVRMVFMNETSVDPTQYAEGFEDSFEYNDETNELVLPARVLEDDFFLEDRPTYINYGILGTQIAKEMSRALHLDALAGIEESPDTFLWKNDTDTNTVLFLRTRCIVDQYHNSGYKIHGDEIFTENYINLISLDIGYEAYFSDPNTPSSGLPGLLSDYHPDQLFWIFYESQFCSGEESDNPVPNEYRASNPVINSRYIGKIFHCLEDSSIMSQDKCIII